MEMQKPTRLHQYGARHSTFMAAKRKPGIHATRAAYLRPLNTHCQAGSRMRGPQLKIRSLDITN